MTTTQIHYVIQVVSKTIVHLRPPVAVEGTTNLSAII